MADAPRRPPLDWSSNVPFPGFSRESRIRLDGEGRFWHEGERVEHPGLARGLHRWIARHPTDGRIVLENGWDWCYLTVDDTPYYVRGVRIDEGVADEGARVVVRLSDESEEPLALASLRVDAQGAIRCEVKHASKGGPFPARFDRHAAAALGEHLHEVDGRVVLRVGARDVEVAHADGPARG